MKKVIIFFILILSFNFLFAAVAVDLVDMHGFISQGFLKSTGNNIFGMSKDGSFKFNEMGLTLSSNPIENLHLGIQLIYRDLTDPQSRVRLDWAYGGYSFRDWLGLRTGIMKIPFGLYNEIRDVDNLRTFVFLPQSVYNENWRDTFNSIEGVGLYGNFTIPYLGDLSYQLQTGKINIPPDGRLAKESSLGLIDIQEIDVDLSNIVHLSWETPLDGLILKYSWLDMDFTEKSTNHYFPNESVSPYWDTDIFTYSIQYSIGNLVASAEYTTYDFNVQNFTVNIPTGNPAMPIVPATIDPLVGEGYYGALTYRFTNWLQLGTYYSEYYYNKDDKDGKYFESFGQPNYRTYLKEAVFTTKFDINEFWTAKLELHKMYGAATTFVDENLDDNGKMNFTDNWTLFGAKVTYNF